MLKIAKYAVVGYAVVAASRFVVEKVKQWRNRQ